MTSKIALALALASLVCATPTLAQEQEASPQITMGNGDANMIQVDGITRQEADAPFSEVRVDGTNVSTFRANTTAVTFPEVVIARNGWLVLHPVIDGRPNGDMVSGFTYLPQGTNEDVTIRIDHPADAGDKFLVMLHADKDEDRVLDFVFVEDGINVEDTAVFEGTHMIAHIFALPE